MAIRFVSIEPAPETTGPTDATDGPEVPETQEPDEVGPSEAPRPAPRPRRARGGGKRGDAVPAAEAAGDGESLSPPAEATEDGERLSPPAEAAAQPPAPAALPGFEDRPKPRRRAARPYWGFG